MAELVGQLTELAKLHKDGFLDDEGEWCPNLPPPTLALVAEALAERPLRRIIPAVAPLCSSLSQSSRRPSSGSSEAGQVGTRTAAPPQPPQLQ